MSERARVSIAGILLGLGLGGFFDGIVFHQLLQWHHLVCRTETCEPHDVDELRRQTFQDGLFHLACWGLTGAGLLMLAAVPRGPEMSGRSLIGGSIAGW